MGNVATTKHWSNHSEILDRRLALEAFRYYEQIGVPSRIAPVSVAAPAYAGIARWLLEVDVDRAMVALTRTAGLSDREGLQAHFSRDTVAALEENVAQRWGERLLVGTKALIERLNNPAMARSAEERLKLLLEMLSRIIARRPEFAGPALDIGLELHAHRGFRHVLEKPLQNLFKRAFKALPESKAPLYRRKLFETRIPATTNKYYTDPAEAASDVNGLALGDAEFEAIISKTIAAVRDPVLRYAAVMRLHWLHESEALTAAQIEAYADALWAEEFVTNGLPDGTPLRPWIFQSLPHPPCFNPASAARERILALKDLDGEDALGTLSGLVGSAPPRIVLTVRELKPFIEMLLTKAAPEPPEPPEVATRRLLSFLPDNGIGWQFWQSFDRLFELAAKKTSLRALFASYYSGSPRLEAARSVVVALEANIITPKSGEDLLLRAWAGDELQSMTAAFASIRWAASRPQGKPLPTVVWDIAADAVVSMDEHAVLAALEFLRGSYATIPKVVPRRLDARLGRALLAVLERTGRPDVRICLPVDPGAVRQTSARLVAVMDRAGRAPKGLMDQWREAGSLEGVGEIREGLRREGAG